MLLAKKKKRRLNIPVRDQNAGLVVMVFLMQELAVLFNHLVGDVFSIVNDSNASEGYCQSTLSSIGVFLSDDCSCHSFLQTVTIHNSVLRVIVY